MGFFAFFSFFFPVSPFPSEDSLCFVCADFFALVFAGLLAYFSLVVLDLGVVFGLTRLTAASGLL